MGDYDGHPFRGNQWTTGTGEVDPGRVAGMEAREAGFRSIAGTFSNPAGGRGVQQFAGVSSLDRDQREAAVVLGHKTRQENTPELLSAASRIEEVSSTAAMLKALGSQETWFASPSSALSEWDAAKQLGAAGASKEVEAALEGKVEGTYSNPYVRMDETTVRAFAERQAEAQAAFRKEYGGDSVTVYRGVKGAQVRAIDKESAAATDRWIAERNVTLKLDEPGLSPEEHFRRVDAYGPPPSAEVSLGVRGLSSWSTSKSDAGTFAGTKGRVLATQITFRDVWSHTGFGVRGVIRYVEDKAEVVVFSKSSSRQVTTAGSGYKPRRKSGW
jgi:hypothetical protein